MKASRIILFGLAMAAFTTSAHAALVVTNLGNRGDGYNVIQIVYSNVGDNTGTWAVPTGVSSVEVLVVGGGGAGASGGAFGPTGGSPGGGAGGLYYNNAYGVTGGGTVNIAVGIGAPTTTVGGNGATGGNSSFGQIIAYGGQGGITSTNQGGNQGGYSINGGANITAGYLGGTGSGATGGAGAGENGRNGGFSPAYGGAGMSVPITGNFGVIDASGNHMTSVGLNVPTVQGFYSIIGYAGGGSAGYDGIALGTSHGEAYGGGSGTEPENNPGHAGFDTLGGGGGGGRGGNGGAGGDGVIYIAYQPIPEPSAALLGGLGLLALLRRWRA